MTLQTSVFNPPTKIIVNGFDGPYRFITLVDGAGCEIKYLLNEGETTLFAAQLALVAQSLLSETDLDVDYTR